MNSSREVWICLRPKEEPFHFVPVGVWASLKALAVMQDETWVVWWLVFKLNVGISSTIMGNINLHVSLSIFWSSQEDTNLLGIDIGHITDKRRLADTALGLHVSGVVGMRELRAINISNKNDTEPLFMTALSFTKLWSHMYRHTLGRNLVFAQLERANPQGWEVSKVAVQLGRETWNYCVPLWSCGY